ncbi:MAG: ATP synthase subunit I [Candidatus Cloacimonetes bacterium]|nr:ATP synthase subunit I [Candidatus Cloacimonadota bacterium]
MSNAKYIKQIMRIMCLTIGIALLFLPWQMKSVASFISGAILSLLNIWWLSRNITGNLSLNENKARLEVFKNFYLRYLILIVCSVILVKFAGINVILYGLGLLTGQIVIIITQLLENVSGSKGQE